MLKTRILTGAGLTLLTTVVLLFSHLPWVLPLATAILSLRAVYELNQATHFAPGKLHFGIVAVGTAILSILPTNGQAPVTAAMLLGAAALFTYLASQVRTLRRIDEWMASLIAVMVPFFFRTMVAIRKLDQGLWLLATAMLTCALTDVMAYFIGRKFGKNKLAPFISPNKTIEGGIGGTLSAVILMTLLITVLRINGLFEVDYSLLICYLCIASYAGQCGDLALSSIKRIVGIKDYSNLLPGHGGVLDRFDSMMFVLPFTYLFCQYFGAFLL